MKTDAAIQQEVLRELRWDSRVPATSVGVTVTAGVVTLTGTVGSYTERLAAQEAAHRVASVNDVANEIEVRGPMSMARTDAEIAQAVRHALEWNAQIPHERIHSTVSNCWVTLEGSVEFEHERQAAEHTVRALAGVYGVTNKIVVGGPRVEAGALRQEIEEVLERRAERAAEHIAVAVGDDGNVTLTGTVDSPSEKEAVLGAVRFTSGVRMVTDHLKVDPDMVHRT